MPESWITAKQTIRGEQMSFRSERATGRENEENGIPRLQSANVLSVSVDLGHV